MATEPADRVLATNVVLTDARGQTTLWRRGTVPPPEVAARLKAHVWVSGQAEPPAPTGARSGAVRRQPPPADPAAGPLPHRDVFTTAAPAPTPEHWTASPAVRESVHGLMAPPDESQDFPQDALEDAEDESLTEPPRAGRGASADRWRTYAASLGQAVDPTASRDAVIAQLVDAGLIPEH